MKWNTDALYNIRSNDARGVVEQAAARIASRCGPGYDWSSRQGRRAPQGRWRAIVFPSTWEARRDNAKNNTLIRSM